MWRRFMHSAVAKYCFYGVRQERKISFESSVIFKNLSSYNLTFTKRFANLPVHHRSLDYVANIIKSTSCQNILVITGAGISTPSGIPDFRSPGIGLYDNLIEFNLRQPTDIFDLEFFKHNPYPFYKLAKELYPGNYKPNYIHYFLRLLSVKNKLLRVYTQNIDGLEILAGIPEDQLVEAHGSFRSATCMKCREKYSTNFIKEDIVNSLVPKCSHEWCNGVIKPDVVFFGEDIPSRFFLCHEDVAKADLMLVLGTSLEVFPVAGLVYEAPSHLPRVLINREIVSPFNGGLDSRDNDAVYCGDIVDGVRTLVQMLGWNEEIDALLKCASSV